MNNILMNNIIEINNTAKIILSSILAYSIISLSPVYKRCTLRITEICINVKHSLHQSLCVTIALLSQEKKKGNNNNNKTKQRQQQPQQNNKKFFFFNILKNMNILTRRLSSSHQLRHRQHLSNRLRLANRHA